MITYIIESQGLYKIGKTKNWGKRQKSYNTTNPLWKLEFLIEDNVETYLHLQYSNKRINNEWFALTNTDLDLIKNQHNIVDTSINTSNKFLEIKSIKDFEANVTNPFVIENQQISKVNLTVAGIDKTKGLSTSSFRVLMYILHIAQSVETKIYIHTSDCATWCHYSQVNQVYSGIVSLIDENFIVKSVKSTFWLNPNYFYNLIKH